MRLTASASALVLLASATVAAVVRGEETPPPPATSLGARVDCLHDFSRDKGASQDCITITGLRIGVRHQASPTVVGTLRVDPFATPVGGRTETPRRAGLPGPSDTELGIIDAYAITWTPRPNLEIAAGSYDGAARMPSVSDLGLANSFALTGWKQSAMTVTYNLSALPDMRVKFAVGNGEGEDGKNLDPQQYFGFEAVASVVKGVRLMLGVSLDGNNIGSDETAFVSHRYQTECNIAPIDAKLGHSTQRLAAGVALDGTMPGLEGFKAALGWQRNVLSDLDKKHLSGPTAATLKSASGCQLDLDSLFVESEDGDSVNTVQQTTYDVSMSYRFLASYFLSLDYTTRHIDTGSVDAFQLCDSYEEGLCDGPARSINKLSQDAVTFGLGMDLAPDLALTFEYHESKFDKKYAQAFYPAPDSKSSTSLDLFNARLSYNWK